MTEETAVPVQENISLRPYNTLGVEARAAFFCEAENETVLKEVLLHPSFKEMPKLILGGGSNILFVDDYEGLVVRIALSGREVVREDDEHVWLKVGAGENWHRLVMHCVERGWGGIENLSLIPGTVGAAPIQNIGAYGVELEEVFDRLEAVDIETAEIRTFTKEECRFGYRDSIFKQELQGKYIVTRVVLKLSKDPVPNLSYGALRSKLEEKGISAPGLKEVSDAVIEIRNSKLPDPSDLGNAGSFFKNPVVERAVYDRLKREYEGIPGYPLDGGRVKVPAGWLIEQTGWKGRVSGKAGTYHQQALVIVNHGGATGAEILEVAEQIRTSVQKRFGIELVPEVNIIG